MKNNILISKPIIMSKVVLRNSDYLEKLGRRAKGDATPKVGKILELYNLRKISQVQTAENVILKLISKDEKEQKKGFKQANKIITKYHEVASLSHRLKQKTTVRIEDKVINNITVGDNKKSKTDIKISLNSKDRDDGKHANFDYIFSTVKRRMIEKVEAMIKEKGDMKIQLTVFYRMKRIQGVSRDKDDEYYSKYPEQYFYNEKEKAWYNYVDNFGNTKAVRVSKNNISEVIDKLKHSVDKTIEDGDVKSLELIKDKLKKYRQSGLEGDGELSYENLVFKYLIRSGHIEKLFDAINKGTDKELSVERKIED